MTLTEKFGPLPQIFLLAVLRVLQGDVQILIDMRLNAVAHDLTKFVRRDRVLSSRWWTALRTLSV
jgi:hypothetical protein